jgi:hypothetical protein
MLDHFEGQRSSLTDDDIVWIVLDDGVSVEMQGIEEPSLANDIGGSIGLLLGEETSGRHRAGEDVFFLGLNSHSLEFSGDVAASALTVVCEEEEWDVSIDQLVDEAVGSRDQVVTTVDNAVHVDEKAMLSHRKYSQSKNVFGRVVVAEGKASTRIGRRGWFRSAGR